MRRDIKRLKKVDNVIPFVISSADSDSETRSPTKKVPKIVKKRVQVKKVILSTKLRKLLNEFKQTRRQKDNKFVNHLTEDAITFYPGTTRVGEDGEIPELLTPASNEGINIGLGEKLMDEVYVKAIREKTMFVTQVDTPSGESRFSVNHVGNLWTIADEIKRVMEAFIKSPFEEPVEVITIGVSLVDVLDVAKSHDGRGSRRTPLTKLGFKAENVFKVATMELSGFSPIEVGTMKGARVPRESGTGLMTAKYWHDSIHRMFEGQADPNILESTACFGDNGNRIPTPLLMETSLVKILERHFETKQGMLIGQVVPVLVLGLHSPSDEVSRLGRIRRVKERLTELRTKGPFFPGTSANYAMDVEFQGRWQVCD